MGKRFGLGQAQGRAKVKTQTINPQLTRGVGGWVAVAGRFAFATSSRVMA